MMHLDAVHLFLSFSTTYPQRVLKSAVGCLRLPLVAGQMLSLISAGPACTPLKPCMSLESSKSYHQATMVTAQPAVAADPLWHESRRSRVRRQVHRPQHDPCLHRQHNCRCAHLFPPATATPWMLSARTQKVLSIYAPCWRPLAWQERLSGCSYSRQLPIMFKHKTAVKYIGCQH